MHGPILEMPPGTARDPRHRCEMVPGIRRLDATDACEGAAMRVFEVTTEGAKTADAAW